MKEQYIANTYPAKEEWINVLSHGIGLILSIFGLILLITKAYNNGTNTRLISFGIFGVSMIFLYAASTFYHNSKNIKLRNRLNIFDHAAIYVLIAGTYTPFTLVTLPNIIGWWIFGIVWSAAIIGIILKIFYTGKYEIISTIMYIMMGWVIIFAIKPLINNLDIQGVWWLFAGGISYTIGAIFYSINKLKFNHAIFHIFVLIGTSCHFVSVYFYV